MTKILIVEDEEPSGKGLENDLTRLGVSALREKNGEAAINCIKSNYLDALVLDLELKSSRVQGLGVLEWVRTHQPHLPVIVVTAHDKLGLRALATGANAVLSKPYDGDHILAYIDRAIELNTLRRENARLVGVLKVTTSAAFASAIPLIASAFFALFWAWLYPGSILGWIAGFLLAVLSIIGGTRIRKMTMEFFKLKFEVGVDEVEDSSDEGAIPKALR